MKCVFKLKDLSTFLNEYELLKSRLVQHSYLLSGHLKSPTRFSGNSPLVRIFLRLGACRLLFITHRFSKPSSLFRLKHSIDFPIVLKIFWIKNTF